MSNENKQITVDDVEKAFEEILWFKPSPASMPVIENRWMGRTQWYISPEAKVYVGCAYNFIMNSPVFGHFTFSDRLNCCFRYALLIKKEQAMKSIDKIAEQYLHKYEIDGRMSVERMVELALEKGIMLYNG